MKIRIRRSWVGGSLLALSIAASSLAATEFWVAPNGSDRNPGTKEQPLGSIAMAQRKARDLRRLAAKPKTANFDPATAAQQLEGGVRIVVRGGTYRLEEPLRFRWEDSGTAASPTIIEAAAGERPVLSGGVRVSGWTRGAELARLPAAARGNVWVSAPLRVGGRVLEIRQLWSARDKATRARYPNTGDMSRLTGWDRAAETASFPVAALGGLAAVDGAEMFLMQQWETAVLRLKTITGDGETARVTFHSPESRIEFEHPWPQPILPPKGAGAFCLVNAPEFLDAPGEWWQDPASGRVYYWPRDGEDLARADAEVIAPVLESLLEFRGTLDRPVAHVEFKGIAFAHTAWTRPSREGHVPLQAGMHFLDAYRITPPGTADWRSLDNQDWIGRIPAAVSVAGGADHLRLERCRFEQIAASALDLGPGTHDSSVEGCVFRDIGGNGLQLGSFQENGVETHTPYDPSDEREWCARVRVANNVFRDTANEDWGCVAVIAGWVREVAIEHNDIADTSYTAVSLGWGWTRTLTGMRNNRVHANLFRRFATRMCDTAAIYTLSAQPGSVLSGNVADDVTISRFVDRPDHWFYYYTDEGSSYMSVRDNWAPAEKFLKNANGPGVVWENNGPMVSPEIKNAAGLEPAWKDIAP